MVLPTEEFIKQCEVMCSVCNQYFANTTGYKSHFTKMHVGVKSTQPVSNPLFDPNAPKIGRFSKPLARKDDAKENDDTDSDATENEEEDTSKRQKTNPVEIDTEEKEKSLVASNNVKQTTEPSKSSSSAVIRLRNDATHAIEAVMKIRCMQNGPVVELNSKPVHLFIKPLRGDAWVDYTVLGKNDAMDKHVPNSLDELSLRDIPPRIGHAMQESVLNSDMITYVFAHGQEHKNDACVFAYQVNPEFGDSVGRHVVSFLVQFFAGKTIYRVVTGENLAFPCVRVDEHRLGPQSEIWCDFHTVIRWGEFLLQFTTTKLTS